MPYALTIPNLCVPVYIGRDFSHTSDVSKAVTWIEPSTPAMDLYTRVLRMELKYEFVAEYINSKKVAE